MAETLAVAGPGGMSDCGQILSVRGRIVHVTADYPDPFQPAKTRAIETLVRLVDDRFDQQIVSLNRTGSLAGFARSWLARPFRPRLQVRMAGHGDGPDTVCYDAPPSGLCHAAMLDQLGDWLAGQLARGPRPALLVGHKLTVEGIAVHRAARLLGIPYALSVQGNTDVKILESRPDLRPRLRRVFHEASMVFPFAPWALARIEARLGARMGPTCILPCPMASDAIIAPTAGGNGLVSAFHLRHHRLKNFAAMAAATDRLARSTPGASMPSARLAIVGGGAPDETAECAAIAARHPAIVLEGPLPLAEMPARFNRASGFVLASRRESFGLVFVEALFAGLPIAYPAGRAIDGFFDGAPFALRIDHRSQASIADAMARLLRDEASLKSALARWQDGPAPARFRRAAIAANFASGLIRAATLQPTDQP